MERGLFSRKREKFAKRQFLELMTKKVIGIFSLENKKCFLKIEIFRMKWKISVTKSTPQI